MRNEDRNSSSKTITYPSCSPGAHFHPSKRGKKSHRLRYAKYPLQGKLTHASQIYPHTTIRNHTTKHIHVFIHRQKGMEAVTRLCAGSPYTRRHSSSSRRALARPHGSQLGLVLQVQHDGNAVKQDRWNGTCTYTTTAVKERERSMALDCMREGRGENRCATGCRASARRKVQQNREMDLFTRVRIFGRMEFNRGPVSSTGTW